ncbi:MAG: helix-turn-helix domain-containing protein [Actinomycetota bacterium]|jgi:excisionase family DNA binding protein|nr:helix-turn-helix domain-containing protein [Actinomycetota bacterium]
METTNAQRDVIEQILSISELAARLRISVQTLYDLRRQGRGPRGFRVGRELRFRLSEVDSWLNRMEQADKERHRPRGSRP